MTMSNSTYESFNQAYEAGADAMLDIILNQLLYLEKCSLDDMAKSSSHDDFVFCSGKFAAVQFCREFLIESFEEDENEQ